MIKQSLLVQRQIPEHIREEYPLFVKFIQAYYDYLYEQQLFDLEAIHDIEQVSTLAASDALYNNFIDKFKYELAKTFPIHMVDDKAIIFKHLREFYLSRGSEQSFKFLFRVLFNKSAEISYPSEQMLRVSDGKWEQDTSIFIKPNVYRELGDITGSFVRITLTSGRIIDTYVKRIVRYSAEIYEVFITREYASEIEAGNSFELVNDLDSVTIVDTSYNDIAVTVTYIPSNHTIVAGDVVTITGSSFDGSYEVSSSGTNTFSFNYVDTNFKWNGGGSVSINKNTSTILRCPSKLSVVNGGSGFRAGQIFLLKSQVGNGCAIKITKTATENGLTGVIKNIQVISFGLDYDTTFYSYLTNSEVVAPEYIHPIMLNGSPNPGDPAYTDITNGFVDSGWAARQEYFYYHDEIPVASDTNRYFADPSYTGTIINQFYNDTSHAANNTVAIIKIELGGVARYPGYYRNNDGFISDIMYIQDGLYYQTFSYVIKVEEELAKYINIIRSLVHPVGMKVFSEYTIYNQMILGPEAPAANPSIYLPVFEEVPSTIFLSDIGIGYTNYILTVDEFGNTITTPDYNSGQVLSAGKPSKIVTKNLTDYPVLLSDSNRKNIEKILPIDELFVEESYFRIIPTVLFEDNYELYGSETVRFDIIKTITSTLYMSDMIRFNKAIVPAEEDNFINITSSGRIRINPYDDLIGDSYFDITNDYQAATPIT